MSTQTSEEQAVIDGVRKQLFIGGEWRDATEGATFAVDDPSTGEILRRAFEMITERIDELALLMTLEMGKPTDDSKAEITYAAEFFRWYSEQAVRIDGHYAIAP